MDRRRIPGGVNVITINDNFGDASEFTSGVLMLARPGDGDFIRAGEGRVNRIIARDLVRHLKGRAGSDNAVRRVKYVGRAVDVQDRQYKAIFERLHKDAASTSVERKARFAGAMGFAIGSLEEPAKPPWMNQPLIGT